MARVQPLRNGARELVPDARHVQSRTRRNERRKCVLDLGGERARRDCRDLRGADFRLDRHHPGRAGAHAVFRRGSWPALHRYRGGGAPDHRHRALRRGHLGAAGLPAAAPLPADPAALQGICLRSLADRLEFRVHNARACGARNAGELRPSQCQLQHLLSGDGLARPCGRVQQRPRGLRRDCELRRYRVVGGIVAPLRPRFDSG